MDREAENQSKWKLLDADVNLDLSLSPYSSSVPSSLLPLRSCSYNLISQPTPSPVAPTSQPYQAPFTTLLPQPMIAPAPAPAPAPVSPPSLDTPKTKKPTTTARRYPPHRTGRTRRTPQSANLKNEKIPPPFPWATDKPATVHSLEYLRSHNIKKITGDVQCKKCNARVTYEFDLNEKFREVAEYVIQNKDSMRDRAPSHWLNPNLPACNQCGQANSLKPVMPDSKEEINWLFLLLGEMLGDCTLEQLKYFCMHTKNHRTGAKNRVLFLTFLALCKQLDPRGPFER